MTDSDSNDPFERAEPLGDGPRGERSRGVAMRLPYGQDAHLDGREPERELAPVVLDEEGHEPLVGP